VNYVVTGGQNPLKIKERIPLNKESFRMPFLKGKNPEVSPLRDLKKEGQNRNTDDTPPHDQGEKWASTRLTTQNEEKA